MGKYFLPLVLYHRVWVHFKTYCCVVKVKHNYTHADAVT